MCKTREFNAHAYLGMASVPELGICVEFNFKLKKLNGILKVSIQITYLALFCTILQVHRHYDGNVEGSL